MAFLEIMSAEVYRAYFVDLFVRVSNLLAQVMYGGLGYTVYRRVRKTPSCLLLCKEIPMIIGSLVHCTTPGTGRYWATIPERKTLTTCARP